MNKLHLRAVRRRAASTAPFHDVLRDSLNRAQSIVAATPLVPMHAQWRLHAATGALECHWVSDKPIEPHPTRLISGSRARRPLRGTGLRPPSRHCAQG